jgi:lysine-N-methylase
MEFYDAFSCIADQCSFTCCEGWKVEVDPDTYNRWNNKEHSSNVLSKKVRIKKHGKETSYYIKMNTDMRCPYLNEKGLCNIVIKFGEDYLSKTCKIFPRHENSFRDLTEYSLSCACPEVVDIINRRDEKIKFSYDGSNELWDSVPMEYHIRKVMIAIMQNSVFSFKDRLLLVFHMLLSLKKELIITKEMIFKYQDEKVLLSFLSIWSDIEINNNHSYQEKKELFIDIVQNYKEVKNFSNYLKDISFVAEDLDTKSIRTQWNNFKIAFLQYEKLMENCFVSKIFTNCINEDMDEMIMSFQLLVTEYVMVEYSSFLHANQEINYSIIRDYIVIYTRIIEYNADGIKEFWEEGFDDAVWDFGYMLLLLN